ncbi:hypothetical protein Ga0609869_002483 [Rhodovulum iodosum]|uniref:Lipoprotein n=1 Tax=Rhodovulum iodosum TaxID=68291 RepID=A0ABV3XWJ3_9RHOB|nr:hypothetical protein [Rhodovulum robiginosum]
MKRRFNLAKTGLTMMMLPLFAACTVEQAGTADNRDAASGYKTSGSVAGMRDDNDDSAY